MTGVALITGGQRGIGLGIARELVGNGFNVAIASQPAQDSEEVIAALKTLGDNAKYFYHDVARADEVSALLDSVEDAFGAVTTYVSNAGVAAKVRGDMLDITFDNFDHALDINLRGGFFLAQQVARRMLKIPDNIYRSMIFITSVSAAMVSVERAEYCISKAGASMMARLFADRLAADNIGVFELRPGIIETQMTTSVKEKYDAQIAGGLVPAKRWGRVEDVGSVAVPLVTGQMAFATGAVIMIDGGLSIPRL